MPNKVQTTLMPHLPGVSFSHHLGSLQGMQMRKKGVPIAGSATASAAGTAAAVGGASSL